MLSFNTKSVGQKKIYTLGKAQDKEYKRGGEI